MPAINNNLLSYRELIIMLAWKNIALRYKQAYLGLAWAVLKPLMLMCIFTLVRSFVGINSGSIPYAALTYAALTAWIFFQESASDGVTSVVSNAHLIKKIYFPREILPIVSVATKLVELFVNLLILSALMAWYGIYPTLSVAWLPALIVYAILASLTVSLFGAAMNVYFRDVGQALPVVLNLMMYASPIIYPLHLVRDRLLADDITAVWGEHLYTLYLLNPLAGIIDSFQRVILAGQPPDLHTVLPGALLVTALAPLSYAYFKRAESYFSDVI